MVMFYTLIGVWVTEVYQFVKADWKVHPEICAFVFRIHPRLKKKKRHCFLVHECKGKYLGVTDEMYDSEMYDFEMYQNRR